MYSSAELDPVVKYFDLAFAAGATADIAWFTGEALALGSPVFDLGCGTGRISLEKRGEYPLPGDGGTLEVYESLSHEAMNQRVDTSLHFIKASPAGNTPEEADSTWSSRLVFKTRKCKDV